MKSSFKKLLAGGMAGLILASVTVTAYAEQQNSAKTPVCYRYGEFLSYYATDSALILDGGYKIADIDGTNVRDLIPLDGTGVAPIEVRVGLGDDGPLLTFPTTNVKVNIDIVTGPDGKIYFPMETAILCCNPDGSDLHKVCDCPFDKNAKIIYPFADGSGIQARQGYYDIASGQYTAGKEVENPKLPGGQYIPKWELGAPPEIEALIPSDVVYNTIHYHSDEWSGDYAGVYAHWLRETDNLAYPYEDLGGQIFIVNKKTCTIVGAFEKNSVSIIGHDINNSLNATEFGLFVSVADGYQFHLYRLLDGGQMELIEPHAWDILAKNGYLYYVYQNNDESGLVVRNDLTPVPLPTTSIY